MAIYVITGIMAAGKSTVAARLAERFDKSVHIRGDVFRRMIINGRQEMSPDGNDEATAQLRLRYTLAASTADTYAGAGFDVVLQDCYLGVEANYLLKQIESRPLYYITLNPSAQAVEKRERERGKTGYGGGWTVENLREVLINENPRVGLWLDSSVLTPAETVDEILRLRDGAKLD